MSPEELVLVVNALRSIKDDQGRPNQWAADVLSGSAEMIIDALASPRRRGRRSVDTAFQVALLVGRGSTTKAACLEVAERIGRNVKTVQNDFSRRREEMQPLIEAMRKG